MKKKYTEKQWQMRHMLNDVVEHFSKNPKELRSININQCLYNPPSDKPKSIGCAIGMYLPTQICKQLDNRSAGTSIVSVLGSSYEKLLPKWMRALNKGFLFHLQTLHDTDHYWSKNGLTPSGEMAVREMIDEFHLPKTIHG